MSEWPEREREKEKRNAVIKPRLKDSLQLAAKLRLLLSRTGTLPGETKIPTLTSQWDLGWGIYLHEGPRDWIPTRGGMWPHQKAIPQEIWFSWLTVFWRSSREKQLQLAAPQKSAICGNFWDTSIPVFLQYYGFSWNCWTFVFEKQLWTAERGDSQNYARKLHPLHLLQLPVFIISFAVLIQGTIKKSRIRIGKRPLALLACDIKTCKLRSPHQKIFSWTGWSLIFFFRYYHVFAPASDFSPVVSLIFISVTVACLHNS